MRAWLSVLALLSIVIDAQRFIALGDWGTEELSRIIPSLLAESDPSITQALFLLGDNFYDDGVSSKYDPLFHSIYESNFVNFSTAIPFQVIAGNHDYHANIQAQIDYEDPLFRRWHFPSPYYTSSYRSPQNVSILTINIDTYLLVGGESSPVEGEIADMDQLRWLERTLHEQAHLFDWVFVLGHYPVYSCNDRGEILAMERHVFPLLKKYHVDVYLSGHVHLLQHISRWGVNMIGSGAGGKSINHSDCVVGSVHEDAHVLAVSEASQGFVVLDVLSPHALQVQFHAVADSSSSIPYHTTLTSQAPLRRRRRPSLDDLQTHIERLVSKRLRAKAGD